MRADRLKLGMKVRVVCDGDANDGKIGVVEAIHPNGASVKIGRTIYLYFAYELSRS